MHNGRPVVGWRTEFADVRLKRKLIKTGVCGDVYFPVD